MSEADRIVPGEVLSYLDMCAVEGVNLQRGMNFRIRDAISVVLMSVRPGRRTPIVLKMEAER